MTISVIIATHNRAALLDECLAHVERQDLRAGDEVIVVDNGSDDATQAVIATHRARCPVPLQPLFEAQPGKSRAIGRALAIAAGEVLAFTDDDVCVDDDWIAAIRQAMADRAVALVGGPVAPRWERPAPRWLRLGDGEYGRLAAPLALLDYGPQEAPLGCRAAIGANLAVRRDVMARVGGFAMHLGKLRGTLRSGEDHDLCDRVRAAGMRTIYCPEARVSHWVPASRMTMRYFLAWFFWSGITHAALEERGKRQGRSLLGIPFYIVRRFAAGVVGAGAAAAVGKLPAAFERTLDAAFAAGYAAGRWRIPGAHAAGIAHPVQARQ